MINSPEPRTRTPLGAIVRREINDLNRKIADDLRTEGKLTAATRVSLQSFFAHTTMWPFAVPIDDIVSENGTLKAEELVLEKPEPSDSDSQDQDSAAVAMSGGSLDLEDK